MPTLRALLPRLAAACLCLSFTGASCGESALYTMPGVINDPHNLSLRRSLLAYGMGQICDQIRARSMPLRLGDGEPVAGRFFPTQCASREADGGRIDVQIGGEGYVWTDKSLRLGFEASASISYEMDFLLADGGVMYVYLRSVGISPPQFVTRLVEETQVSMFNRIFGGAAGGVKPTDSFGSQVMGAQLVRGFTLIRDPSGGVEVETGIVPPGTRPPGAFAGLDHSRPVLANERVELHQNQRDFAGPFDVPAGKQLGVLVNVSGAPPATGGPPAIDMLLVPRAVADPWIAAYVHQREVTPPPGPMLLDAVVAGGSGYRAALPVPPGSYYLVLDNTAVAGRISPPSTPRDDRALLVSYAVDLE